MDRLSIIYLLIAFIGWGVSSFIAKIAANKIGERAVFWDIIAYLPVMLLFGALMFRTKLFAVSDRDGILYAIIAGVFGAIAAIADYYLLSRREASSAIPLLALYPALTVILAFIFLNESITVTKVIGIILALIAGLLLSF